MKYLNLLLLFVTASVGSQNIALKWSKKTESKENVTILGGKDGQYVTRYRSSDKNLVFRVYDKDMNLKNEKIIGG